MKNIVDYLVNKYHFTKLTENKNKYGLDLDKFTHSMRIAEIHYLFYSEKLKYFSLVVLYERVKGKAGGGYKDHDSIMIPRLIKTKKDVDEVITGVREK